MLALVTLVVDDYDRAIAWYRDALGFELVEDSPSLTTTGSPKRWVVVRPPDGGTGLLLAPKATRPPRSATRPPVASASSSASPTSTPRSSACRAPVP